MMHFGAQRTFQASGFFLTALSSLNHVNHHPGLGALIFTCNLANNKQGGEMKACVSMAPGPWLALHTITLNFLIKFCMQLASTNQKWLFKIQSACLKEQTFYVTKRHIQRSFENLRSSLTATETQLSHRDLGNTWLPKPSPHPLRIPQDIPKYRESRDSLWSLESGVGGEDGLTLCRLSRKCCLLFKCPTGPQNTLSTEKWLDTAQPLPSEHTAIATTHSPLEHRTPSPSHRYSQRALM